MAEIDALGIDLGTSNSVIAVWWTDDRHEIVDVVQTAAPAVVVAQPLLPSAAYIPQPSEFAPHALALPWESQDTPHIVGAFARDHGALRPDRLVSSAKSWLCNRHVDRKAPLLPWGSDTVAEKLSPFAATQLYLEHLRHALEHWIHGRGAELPAEVPVVLTVPASFDDVARALTHDAAVSAGFQNLLLLEEPQAAFYAWIAEHPQNWQRQIQPGDLILVCDVGGGTSDFSLIAVLDDRGSLSLERVSVGDHLLLGGDNMDLALAVTLRQQLMSGGRKLDNWQFLSLVHGARAAKELLLSDPNRDEVPIAVASRGSSLFKETLAATLTRDMVNTIVIEGFLPFTAVNDHPATAGTPGLSEFGLEYTADPALSKHLARFLVRSLENVRSDDRLRNFVGDSRQTSVEDRLHLQPTAVLFNGGVFNAAGLTTRVEALLSTWSNGKAPRRLDANSLELAVARGAAYYGHLRRHEQGLRIRAGTARSYYIGIAPSMPSVPGYTPPLRGLCIVPQGLEEGSELRLDKREFGLLVGEPATFSFFCSAIRAGDKVGDVVENAREELDELSPLQITLSSATDSPGQLVPVRLRSLVNDVGVLELWMERVDNNERWKIEFSVRG